MAASKFIEHLDDEQLQQRTPSYLDVRLQDLVPDLWGWDDGVSSVGSMSLTTGTATTATTSVENIHSREDLWSSPSHTNKAPSSNRLSRMLGLGGFDPSSIHTSEHQHTNPTSSKRQSRFMFGLTIPESGSAAAALESLNGGEVQPSSPRSDKAPSTNRMSRLIFGQGGIDATVVTTIESPKPQQEGSPSSSKRRSRAVFGLGPNDRSLTVTSAPNGEVMKENLPPPGLEKSTTSKRQSRFMLGFNGFDGNCASIPELVNSGGKDQPLPAGKPAASKRRSMFIGSKPAVSIYGDSVPNPTDQALAPVNKPASSKRRSLMIFGHSR
jgi:hypothetical protein